MSLLDQVVKQLASIELKDDDIAEYIAGIVEDASMEEEEKRDVITEFLSEATDKDTTNFVSAILNDWKKAQEEREKEADERKAKLIADAKVREEERRLKAEKEQEENRQLRNAQKELSKEQKEAREKLMQQYGYVTEGGDDEDGESRKVDELASLSPKDRRKNKHASAAPSIGQSKRRFGEREGTEKT
ncbi:hypothetical protein BDF20DRAFT_833436 [Mycotypha africana]|uniref:uncharacterized protein n=1 Tax=Mycotypha africana TaxID=64632 RepID=UPI002300A919|nr:uncharacterized protein BDF20DRAFT_833436 [Mycotypha africana]KAI8988602.1 hypothetical protein BDF20DRAFT_833436 [Mycotypha africana]